MEATQTTNPAKTLTVTIPLRLSLGLNSREHWRARMARVKYEKSTTYWAIAASKQKLPPLPVVVTLTRVGKRKCDSDNCPGALKAVRDSIADLYGTDDGSDLYGWVYKQQIGKDYAVLVSIVSLAPAGGGKGEG